MYSTGEEKAIGRESGREYGINKNFMNQLKKHIEEIIFWETTILYYFLEKEDVMNASNLQDLES